MTSYDGDATDKRRAMAMIIFARFVQVHVNFLEFRGYFTELY